MKSKLNVFVYALAPKWIALGFYCEIFSIGDVMRTTQREIELKLLDIDCYPVCQTVLHFMNIMKLPININVGTNAAVALLI